MILLLTFRGVRLNLCYYTPSIRHWHAEEDGNNESQSKSLNNQMI